MLIPQEFVIQLMKEKGKEISGVLHIGAHDCEELDFYKRIGLSSNDCYWIDAIETKVEQAKARGIPHVYQAVVSDTDGQDVTFHVTNNIQSSSLLDFGTHADSYKWCVVTHDIQLKTSTLKTWVATNTIPISKLNFWNLDIQGAELLALKGAGDLLRYAEVLYLEVNTQEVYKGCAKVWELDEHLNTYGFSRVHTIMTNDGWGDAIYIRA